MKNNNMHVVVIDYWIDKENNRAYLLAYKDGQIVLSEGNLEKNQEEEDE